MTIYNTQIRLRSFSWYAFRWYEMSNDLWLGVLFEASFKFSFMDDIVQANISWYLVAIVASIVHLAC